MSVRQKMLKSISYKKLMVLRVQVEIKIVAIEIFISILIFW